MKQNCLVVINHALYFTVKNNRKKDKLEVFNQKKNRTIIGSISILIIIIISARLNIIIISIIPSHHQKMIIICFYPLLFFNYKYIIILIESQIMPKIIHI